LGEIEKRGRSTEERRERREREEREREKRTEGRIDACRSTVTIRKAFG
jgi:hypothetical protein